MQFQKQFTKVHCPANAKNATKCVLKRNDCHQSGRDLLNEKKTKKKHENPEKKRKAVEKRYDTKETIKQYEKEKFLESSTSKLLIRKQSIRKILKCNRHIKNANTEKILKIKKNIK